MCGIVGIYTSDWLFDWRVLESGRDEMIARGPDDSGSWRFGGVGLAHRRLAVLDLSPGGHQPMVGGGGRVAIVFNGEIYNHVELRNELVALGVTFRTASDTEVLLNAYLEWGTECLSHLSGMFVFAIYDARQEQLFLARDRAGEKPLFWYQDGTSFRFASELKALLADKQLPRRVQSDALDCYLMMGYVPGPLCILEGFNKLPPAHAMVFDIRTLNVRTWRYWELPDVHEHSASVDELRAELAATFDAAIRRQLIADVPVGVLLSGGLDSSLVTAFAARRRRVIKTFSVSFRGQPQFDESAHSRMIARHFATDHTEIDVRPQSASVLLRLARQFDEPVADSSVVPTFLLTEAVRRHCTVALGGDGADELFGGYKNYSKAVLVEQLTKWMPTSLRSCIAHGASMIMPLGTRGRTWFQYLGSASRTPVLAPHFESQLRRSLLSRHVKRPLSAENHRDFPIGATCDLTQRLTRADFFGFLPEDILVKVDRASMLNSLEVRSPYLDHKVVEFAFSRIPSSLKVTPRGRKLFLKNFAREYLPAQFDISRKQGFTAPIDEWIKSEDYCRLFKDVLYNPGCPFEPKVINKLFLGLNSGRANGERIFAIGFFELWRRSYSVTI